MGDLIDIRTWRERTNRAATGTPSAESGAALERRSAADAWRRWSQGDGAAWLRMMLGEAVDHHGAGDDFCLDGLPVPPRVEDWLRHGELVLRLSRRAIIARMIDELRDDVAPAAATFSLRG